MKKLSERDKRRETKSYFTQDELDAMDRFIERAGNIDSRNELFRVAVQYYMHQHELSDGVVDRRKFPVLPAALPQDATHESQKPARRPQSA